MTTIYLGGEKGFFWVRIQNFQYFCSVHNKCGQQCPFWKKDQHFEWGCTHHTFESYKPTATIDSNVNLSRVLHDKIDEITRSSSTEEELLISLLEVLSEANDSQ